MWGLSTFLDHHKPINTTFGSPPMTFYSRKPVIVLPQQKRTRSASTATKESAGAVEPETHEDNLDRHVEDCLNKPDTFRRVMRGVWSFLKTRTYFYILSLAFSDFGNNTALGVSVAQLNCELYSFMNSFRLLLPYMDSTLVSTSGILLVVNLYSIYEIEVFWGAGIVFFLGKLINVHNSNTQGFWVELCQQVETGMSARVAVILSITQIRLGLFSLTSIGLIPCRIVDTYSECQIILLKIHRSQIYLFVGVCKIWHYKHKTEKLRKQAGLPELYDADDLPDPVYDKNYVHVLSEDEQIDLHYRQ